MDMKLELVPVPVTDVDRAKSFYVDMVGFNLDHDHQVNDQLRFVQLTPPGSACSIVMGVGITEMPPGSQKGLQVVVHDVEAVRRELLGRGVKASEVQVQTTDAQLSNSVTMREIDTLPQLNRTPITISNIHDAVHPTVMQGQTVSGTYHDGTRSFTLKGTNSYFTDRMKSKGKL